jgi:glycosyltransferase involved in cell wall biosynthesis
MLAWRLAGRSARVAWQVARWPFIHRRLPNRQDARRLIHHLHHVVSDRSEGNQNRDPYDVWLANNRWTSHSREAAEREVEALASRPLISVVVPVHNVDACWLKRAVESVQSQIYPQWELCIAEDCATVPHIRPLLRQMAADDSRIHVRYLEKNVNISLATNAAAELASGEFLLFLDQDDELTPDCLLELAKAIVRSPGVDIVYSDYDKIDLAGRRYGPVFKPDWSPELLLSYMYFGHIFAPRRELFLAEGGFRPGFEGCQDFDLALRLTDKPRRIAHIPRVLYHWRCLPTSTASSGAAKPEAFERGRRAIQEAIDRRGIDAKVSRPEFAVRRHFGLFQLDFPDTGPRVAIVIPAGKRLKRCIESIRAKTSYRDYEIVVIDPGDSKPEIQKYLRQLPLRCRSIRIDEHEQSRNQPAILNAAVRNVDADYVVFLDDELRVRRPEWLSQMVGYAQIDGVAVVGARLLQPTSKVRQGGFVVGPFKNNAIPLFRGLTADNDGYSCLALTAHNCSAVSASCMLIKRDLFLGVGGFDQTSFLFAYHDIDLCLRLIRRGLRCVYASRSELMDYRNTANRAAMNSADTIAFRERWGEYRDPYYNPNLALGDKLHQIETRRSPALGQVPATPLRVLFCTHNLHLEGAPLSLYELVTGLAKRGLVEPTVFCHAPGPLGERYRQAGIPVHIGSHALADKPEFAEFQRRVERLGDWIREQGFDVVLANTLDSYWFIHAARSAGLPSLWIIRESMTKLRGHFGVFGPWMIAPALKTFEFPYRTIFVAEATRELYTPLSGNRNMSVIPNGLRRDAIDQFRQTHGRQELREQLGLPAEKTIFLITGTVCERKGQLEFARAALRLVEQGRSDVLFLVVGCVKSEYQTRLEEFIKVRSEHFRLVPTTNKTLHYLMASDVFVCCSRNESYPRVILEAMASEIPIITTPVYGIAEQVCHDFSALVYSPDDVETLASHMSRLADYPEDRDRLRNGASRHLNTLVSYDQMLTEYERLILEAAATSESRSARAFMETQPRESEANAPILAAG